MSKCRSQQFLYELLHPCSQRNVVALKIGMRIVERHTVGSHCLIGNRCKNSGDYKFRRQQRLPSKLSVKMLSHTQLEQQFRALGIKKSFKKNISTLEQCVHQLLHNNSQESSINQCERGALTTHFTDRHGYTFSVKNFTLRLNVYPRL